MNLRVDAEFSAPRGRNFSGARDSKDFDLSRPPPPPPRALERAAQDAVERERKENQRRGKQQKKGGIRKCFRCGLEGHTKRLCPSLAEKMYKKRRTKVPAHVVAVPHSPASVSAGKDEGPSKADLELAERVERLERWLERSEVLRSGEAPR